MVLEMIWKEVGMGTGMSVSFSPRFRLPGMSDYIGLSGKLPSWACPRSTRVEAGLWVFMAAVVQPFRLPQSS